MSGFSMSGLRPEQGPPLGVPASFFLTGPLALVGAGGLLLVTGGEGVESLWAGVHVALVHLATVGLLLLVMVGALYQMLPVVAGAVVPRPRLAHGVHALLVAGALALVWGQGTGRPGAFALALGGLGGGLLLFLVPALWALVRANVRSPTAHGMWLALAGLAAVAGLGLTLALVRSGGAGPSGDWAAWRYAHAHLGFLVWVGGLTSAVSWQVVPMFYLAASPPRWEPRVVLGGVGVSLVVLLAVVVLGGTAGSVAWAALPGALAVWLVHPLWVARVLRARKRKRKDASVWLWGLSMGCALLCLPAGAASAWLEAPWVPLVYGLLVLWGWAGALVHGMLTRIVPFLVWLHRCAPLVGVRPVPSTRELYPDRYVALGFWLHAGTLAVGVAAALVQHALLWRALGLGVGVTGALLAWRIAHALLRGRGLAAGAPAAGVPTRALP